MGYLSYFLLLVPFEVISENEDVVNLLDDVDFNKNYLNIQKNCCYSYLDDLKAYLAPNCS